MTTPAKVGDTTPASTAKTINPAKNVFYQFPPIIPMVFLATTLVAMAQFGSTERLAAAFAWLIFVAILLANGKQALDNITTGGVSPSGGGGGPKTN